MCTDLHNFWYATLPSEYNHTDEFVRDVRVTCIPYLVIVDDNEIMPFISPIAAERNVVHPPEMWPPNSPDLIPVDCIQRLSYPSREGLLFAVLHSRPMCGVCLY